MSQRSRLTGFGGYLPENVVTNSDLAEKVDTSDAWIRERTGIVQRHIALKDDTVVSMGVAAAQAALRYAGVPASEIGAIIVATATPDQIFPAAAVRIQAEIGAENAFGFDLSAACSGFVYALSVADAFIRSGQVKRALVIGSEIYSRILDWEDRSTCVLFGDGAGAVLLESVPESEPGILSTHLHSDGNYGDMLYLDGPLVLKPLLHMQGREVFRHAVSKLADVVEETLRHNNYTVDDLTWLVPHQANSRIIEGMGKKLGLPPEKVIITVDQHANTSAASVPLALNGAVRDGRIKRGDLVLLEALGGGLTWGSALLRL